MTDNMKHHTIEDVLAQHGVDVKGARIGTVRVASNESADDPASTQRRIYGPAVVTYMRYADGGIDTTVEREGD